MMTGSWDPIFRARLSRAAFPAILCACSLAANAHAAATEMQPVTAIAKRYRENPLPSARLELMTFAQQHAGDSSGALAHFALGMTAFEQRNYPDAVLYLKLAQPALPKLADYLAFYMAAAQAELNDYPSVAQGLSALTKTALTASPLAPKITMLQAHASIRTQKFGDAVQLLRAPFASLPQPDADLALARAYEGRGELPQAATLYQRIYYTRPATKQAEEASAAMDRLKASMAKGYPPPGPERMLARGDQWMAAKQYAKAKQEFHDMQPALKGLEHDQAAVRTGAAQLLGGDAAGAFRYLKELHLGRSEAGAERDYYLEEAARKLGTQGAAADEALHDLEAHYPASGWRLKALMSAGNAYVAARQPDRYTPLFRTAFEKFPSDPTAAVSHWRLAWDAYLADRPDAQELMREQLRRFPEEQRAASALYFLGRLAESRQDFSSARAYYERLQRAFPHYYYGTLGAGRLTDSHLVSAKPSAEVEDWLDGVAFATTADYKLEEPNAATKAHMERAALLRAAGFADWAATELRFGATHDGQRHLLAIELARGDATVALSLRHMKGLAPDYLLLDYERAPKELWGYLFPLPYQDILLKSARVHELDPYLVAGLIRQESEFNPDAVSRAKALGLTQLMPGTGSMMARQTGLAGFQTKMLFDPKVSLDLGMRYLRTQLDLWNGSLEQTLAAYNAGPGRVRQWTAGMTFREPAEFVESIPFTETRDYVQSVIRNATVYRQLYTSAAPPPQPIPQTTPQAGNALLSTHVEAPHAAAAASKPGAAARSTVKRKRAGTVPQRAH